MSSDLTKLMATPLRPNRPDRPILLSNHIVSPNCQLLDIWNITGALLVLLCQFWRFQLFWELFSGKFITFGVSFCNVSILIRK